MNKLVTVAIASYNNAEYINKCIKSVVTQTYSSLEIIIVDDGSTDDSLKIIEYFNADSRVRVIAKENGGLSSVRQRALDEACGKYICFIDADDYLAPRYVEEMVHKLESDNSEICVCGVKCVDSRGRILPKYINAFKNADSTKPEKLVTDKLISGFPLKVYLSDSWNKMFDIGFIRSSKVSFSLPKGFNGSDTAFNIKLAFHEPIYSTISDELYYHVIHDDSAVRRKNKRLLDGFHIIIEQFLDEMAAVKNQKLLRYIKSQYSGFLRYAFQDGVLESSAPISVIKENRFEYLAYINKHNNLTLYVNEQDTLSSFIFVFLLKYMPVLLMPYFKLRSVITLS